MRLVRKILFYLLLAIVLMVTGSAVYLLANKERIIREFIRQANTQLNTPVRIGEIDVSPWSSFPNFSIILSDVYVEDSQPGKSPLLTAKRISFVMNPLSLWRGDYNIKGIRIRDSETHLKIDREGNNNYTILKDTTGSGQGLRFNLKDVSLTNAFVSYTDSSTHRHFGFSGSEIKASISSDNDIYDISAQGDVTINKFRIDHSALLEGKTFDVTTNLQYLDPERKIEISSGALKLQNSEFEVKGSYSWKNKQTADFTMDGKNTDIQTLLSLLPQNVSDRLAQYRSKGDVFFSVNLKGLIGSDGSPSLSMTFGFHHTTIYHPELQSQLEDASLEGSFATPSLRKLDDAVLVLNGIEGTLNNNPFSASLVIHNMNDPDVQCALKGTFDIASLLNFYPIKEFAQPYGSIDADISFQGKTEWLKSRSTAQQTTTTGTVTLKNTGFLYGDKKIPFENLSGILQFNDVDLAMSDVTGKMGNTDFKLNGVFKNIITDLLFENQPIGIEADLQSHLVDLDQLFSYGFGTATAGINREYEFRISPLLNMNFNCSIDRLHYRRFAARNIKGDLLIKNQVAVSRGTSMQAMGGNLSLTGIVDAKNDSAVDVVSTFNTKGVHIDSIFYVFENFNQDFIQDKHLRGEADAEVNMEMTLNRNLHLIPESLVADIGIEIKHGQLNNFTPLRELDRYLDDEGLDHLVFADLHNDIHIENDTIYIPQMEVRSNVTAIKITGTHTFDQHIDYRVIAPLRNKHKINVTEAGDAIEEDQGGTKLYLKITGTSDDYRVTYDIGAVKKKIINDIKDEARELKEAFRTKGETRKKALELSDETFDWDNPKN